VAEVESSTRAAASLAKSAKLTDWPCRLRDLKVCAAACVYLNECVNLERKFLFVEKKLYLKRRELLFGVYWVIDFKFNTPPNKILGFYLFKYRAENSSQLLGLNSRHLIHFFV
jgi:hypothetical protein